MCVHVYTNTYWKFHLDCALYMCMCVCVYVYTHIHIYACMISQGFQLNSQFMCMNVFMYTYIHIQFMCMYNSHLQTNQTAIPGKPQGPKCPASHPHAHTYMHAYIHTHVQTNQTTPPQGNHKSQNAQTVNLLAGYIHTYTHTHVQTNQSTPPGKPQGPKCPANHPACGLQTYLIEGSNTECDNCKTRFRCVFT